MYETERDLLNDISQPDPGVLETLGNLDGDLMLLGAGGKIGHGLALMAKRALDELGSKHKVLAVSRFSSPGSRELFEADGITVIPCDLTDTAAVRDLPDSRDIVYLVGQKFGTAEGNESTTWLMNAYVPGVVCERFSDARIAAYSSGNVYAYVSADDDGPLEDGELGPIGEYAQSVVGRERVFEWFSRNRGTKVSTLRLNYANEPRYGVLVDIGNQVLNHQPVDLTQPNANVVWAGDCNRVTLCSLDAADSPPTIINLAGPKVYVRDVAKQFADIFGVDVQFTGTEAAQSMLNNGANCWKRFGPPRVSVDDMIERIASWLKGGHGTWNKPTHFEVRNGKF